MHKSLRNRDIYLRQLKAFQDTEMIKVITGIRRCGKSCLMKLMVEHLRGSGIGDKQIVEMNFESMRFAVMTAKDLYRYVSERVIPGKRMYLFFDEVQRLDGWENAVNSFRVDFDCDIYITCCPRSFPLISPGGMWRSRYCLYRSGSFWISTDIPYRSARRSPDR